MTSPRLASPSNSLGIILSLAIIAGGGGVAYGLANLTVQLVVLALLAANRDACFQFWREACLALRLLMIVALLLPAVSLIPLPFDIWQTLPGRQLASDTLSSIGVSGWHPASLDPGRTLVAVTGLIVPFALLALGHAISRINLVKLAWGIVALGLANLVLGIPQVLSNGQLGLLYPENPMPGVLFGTFANRNSTGLFLVCCLALALLLPSLRPERWFSGLRVTAIALLGLSIILTGSRSSMALAIFIAIIGALRWHKIQAGTSFDPRRVSMIAGSIALAAIVGLTVLPGSRAGQAIDRFAQIEDARAYIWEDAAYSANRYWPLGSGVGTFDEVAQADESLENLTVRKAGRAHNDYLEVAVEAGLPGLLLIAGWLLLIAWQSFKARGSPDRWIAWAGSAILAAIAAQSAFDYPLRNQAMLAVAAFAILLLLRFGRPREQSQ